MQKDGKPLVALPSIDFYTVSVALEAEQRAAYDKVSRDWTDTLAVDYI